MRDKILKLAELRKVNSNLKYSAVTLFNLLSPNNCTHQDNLETIASTYWLRLAYVVYNIYVYITMEKKKENTYSIAFLGGLYIRWLCSNLRKR